MKQLREIWHNLPIFLQMGAWWLGIFTIISIGKLIFNTFNKIFDGRKKVS